MKPTSFIMGYFKNPDQGKAEMERKRKLTNTEKWLEAARGSSGIIISTYAEKIPASVRQFMRINVDRFDLAPEVWDTIYQLHKSIWQWRTPSISDRDLVYHLGLANLANHFNMILEEIDTNNDDLAALLERLFVLQFGEEYPDPFRELNMLSSYPDCIEGFKRWQPEQTPAENAKEAVSTLLASLSSSNRVEQSRLINARNAYMDGCIRIIGDLIAHFQLANPEIEWDIPSDWSDGKERTIGNIFDDYLSQL